MGITRLTLSRRGAQLTRERTLSGGTKTGAVGPLDDWYADRSRESIHSRDRLHRSLPIPAGPRSGLNPEADGPHQAAREPQVTNLQREAGVRVSMLRPRLRWSSISAAAPIMRPRRKTVNAAVSSSCSVIRPDW